MRRDRDEGQAAVELALVLPLVVLLLLAVVQVTLVARDQVLVVHAARNAAREAAVDPDRPGAPRAAATSDGSLKSSRLEVEVHTVGGDRQDLVVVQLGYDSPTDVPLIGPLLPDVRLGAKAAMRAESASDLGIRRRNVRFRQELPPPVANTPLGAPVFPGSVPTN